MCWCRSHAMSLDPRDDCIISRPKKGDDNREQDRAIFTPGSIAIRVIIHPPRNPTHTAKPSTDVLSILR